MYLARFLAVLFNRFDYYTHIIFEIVWLSNVLVMSDSDEGKSRKALHTQQNWYLLCFITTTGSIPLLVDC